MEPTFFATPAALRAWFEDHHHTAPELWLGFHKKGSGRPSVTWPEAVDQALCFGWIDGVRKSLDEANYTIRFTPRRPRSIWSAVNIKRVGELQELGLMQPAGLKAFAERTQERSGIYAYEQRGEARLAAADEQRFRANRRAWDFFQAQAPWYQRTATWWVVSAREVVDRRVAAVTAQIAAIIADGVARGEFAVEDPLVAARAVFDATARFHDPVHAPEWSDPAVDAAFEGCGR